ncbi:phage tail protein [Georgenia sp. 10Sc9-8]|uniref:Phage tail protein n=1 Tax=Georgenia halotolerans TaxID=3028317 RepID=A0ABT5TXA6_9MICO|nr:phage tail protein [Georgenia halotolerans]
MGDSPTELVLAFRFQVHLSRSLPGRTLAPPPGIRTATTSRITAAPSPAPGRVASTGSAPTTTEGTAAERLGDGGFQECTGLELDADVHEYLEGGGNDTTVRRLGRVKHAPVVLKRGMLVPEEYTDTALWDWMHAAVTNRVPLPRYDGRIEVMDPSGRRVVARWTFVRALPLKVVGPALHAATGALAVEEIHLAHEGLRIEAAP